MGYFQVRIFGIELEIGHQNLSDRTGEILQNLVNMEEIIEVLKTGETSEVGQREREEKGCGMLRGN